MESDLIFRALGAAIGWGLIGLVLAFAIKLIAKRERLPRWPIVACIALGVLVSLALNMAPTPN
jgi:hypothetical protein